MTQQLSKTPVAASSAPRVLTPKDLQAVTGGGGNGATIVNVLTSRLRSPSAGND